MVKELTIDLGILHNHRLSMALVHGFIRKEAEERGYMLAGKKFIKLTGDEISAGININRFTVWRAIKELVEHGYIERIKLEGSLNISYAVV
jgi:predicted transcriptional regulator|nr:MAG TPA: winged helix-turn-helix domain protein [Caudoviricetes sp.]